MDYPTHKTVHELFQDRVREQPDAVAVTCGETNLTYRQLDELITATEEKCIGTNHKPTCLRLGQGFKGQLDLARRARM